ncbi:MAG: type IV pilus assembly protein PilM [Desulfobacterales bacterium]
MLFTKKDQLVGLDIGSRTIKVAEIKGLRKGDKPSLKKFGMIDISHGAIEEGGIKKPEEVADAIKQLFKAYNIRESNVAVSVGGYSLIVKKINVQSMTEEQLQETIQFEAEQYIPFDIKDVNLDFQILGENKDGHRMNVLLVAAKSDMVDSYISLLEMVGLNPRIIDVEAFALQNIFEFNYKPKKENVALIDIGAGKTSLNILKGRDSVFMRDVSLGCGQINQKIVNLLDCTMEEADQIKFSENSDRISPEDLNEIISSVVSDWCVEIKRALEFFYSTYPDDQIMTILISGGGGNIEKFKKLLAAETTTRVETINPFKGFYLDEDKIDPSYIKQIAPQAAICMGLAIRRVNDK